MTTLVLKHSEWDIIRQRIDADYGIVVAMISWKTKETLGFTVRHHRVYHLSNHQYVDDIRLDFVNEDSLVFFKLKYL
jgi:hypothetical protein